MLEQYVISLKNGEKSCNRMQKFDSNSHFYYIVYMYVCMYVCMWQTRKQFVVSIWHGVRATTQTGLLKVIQINENTMATIAKKKKNT